VTGPEQAPRTRFEATVRPAARPGEVVTAAARADVAGRVADLDLDRVPDAGGEVRVLLDLADVGRLAEQGLEVHVERALPVQPLDPALVTDDADVQAWLAARVRGSS
jgi:hypothetical protein